MKTDLRPPGPVGQEAKDAARALRRDPLAVMADLSRTYGDISYLRIGWQEVFILTHPEDVRDVLVNRHRHFIKGVGPQNSKLLLGNGLFVSEGAFHRRQRRLLQPTMHPLRLREYAPLMVEFSTRLADRWAAGETVDVYEAMMQLALWIVGKAIFDTDFEESQGRALAENLTICMEASELKAPPSVVAESERFRTASRALDGIIEKLIDDKTPRTSRGHDVVSLLLDARDADGDQGGLTDRQIRDEALSLLVAGHETSANTLTWAWYCLSQNPEVEARFHDELDRVLGDRLPTHEDYAKLEHTKAIFAETLRLYPQVPFLDRRVVAEFPLHDYVLPVDSVLFLPAFLIQRDPRFFPEPERFRPERWEGTQIDGPHPAYFPFSLGPRVCLGEPMAWLEGVLVLATLGQRWRMRLLPDHEVVMRRVVTLRPLTGMPMVMEPRRAAT